MATQQRSSAGSAGNGNPGTQTSQAELVRQGFAAYGPTADPLTIQQWCLNEHGLTVSLEYIREIKKKMKGGTRQRGRPAGTGAAAFGGAGKPAAALAQVGKAGAWTPEEIRLMRQFVRAHGLPSTQAVAAGVE